MSKTNKFNVGDVVRTKYELYRKIRTGTVVEINSGIHNDDILVRFENFSKYGHFGNGYTLSGINYKTSDHYYMNEDHLELVSKVSNPKIVIYRNGKNVIAKNTETGETAKATCHPDDPFDFNIGAKLAFERLMNPTKIVKQDKYAVGDRVKFRSDLVLNKRYGNLDWLLTMDRTMKGKEVTVCYISEDGFIKVKEDGICFYYDPTMFEGKVVSVEELKKEEPKLYNGKVVCVDNTANPTSLTVGKIYEFVDGQFKDNDGKLRPYMSAVHTLDEFHKCGCFAKFIEVVE